MGLEGIIVLAVIGVFRKERSAGHFLHVSRSILGVLLPKGWVIILVLKDDHSPDDINKWDTHHTRYMGKKVLYLVKEESDKGQGGIFGLLVLGSPIVLIMLLLSQEAYHPLEFHTHKHL
jgi:hypothetical protein